MSKNKKKEDKKTYTIIRKEDGYIVVDQEGNQVTHQDVWPLTISKLEKIIRKELEI